MALKEPAKRSARQIMPVIPLASQVPVTWTILSERPMSTEIEGQPSIESPGTVRLVPGPHQFRFRAPGCAEMTAVLEALPRRDSVLNVRLVPPLSGRWHRVDPDGGSVFWSLSQKDSKIGGFIEPTRSGPERETVVGDLLWDGRISLSSKYDNGDSKVSNGGYYGTVSADGSRIDGRYEITAHNNGPWVLVRVRAPSPEH